MLGRMVDGRLEKGEATREHLVETSRRLFGQQGYEGTPIEAILAAAQISRGSLYHHFKTKQALFDAVIERVVSDAAETATRTALAAPDPASSVRAGFRAWLELARDPALQRILLDGPAVLGWARCRQIDVQHVLGGLRASLQKIADQDGLPRGDVNVFAHMLLAAVSEAAFMIATADDPEATLASTHSAVDAFLERLIAPTTAG
jgi:AcrR family transcriptional regulator